MLDEDADETLKAAEDGAVDDDGGVLGVVGADVAQLKPLGDLEAPGTIWGSMRRCGRS